MNHVEPDSPVWLNTVAAIIVLGSLGAFAFWRYQRRQAGNETLMLDSVRLGRILART